MIEKQKLTSFSIFTLLSFRTKEKMLMKLGSKTALGEGILSLYN